MRIAEINIAMDGSTGKIMLQIAQTARNDGYEVKTFSPVVFSKVKKNKSVLPKEHMEFGFFFENGVHRCLGTLLGYNGCFSHFGTWQLIRQLERFQPDIIHLHNLHGFCINLPMLFRYIKRNNIRVVWTLHDCWPFTGHCPYFMMAECDRWKTGCHHCPQPRVYPRMYLDTSKRMYTLKKKWFSGVKNMTLVTPSDWLEDLTKQSFLKDYPVEVINNGIDLDVFQPTSSDFRNRYGITQDKHILLGVTFGWNARKGLDVFIELAKRLDSSYQIVLVGTDDRVDVQLPTNIISIHRTQNQKELAEIYSSADLFVNPTREDNYPTVNMECLACGTPVLTFRTGGSPEIVDGTCGCVVDCDNVDAMEKEIQRICVEHPYSRSACCKRAISFDMNEKFQKYLSLYENASSNITT